jgi:hypothetical protein
MCYIMFVYSGRLRPVQPEVWDHMQILLPADARPTPGAAHQEQGQVLSREQTSVAVWRLRHTAG